MDMTIARGVYHQRAHSVDENNRGGVLYTNILDDIASSKNLFLVADGGVRHAAIPFLEGDVFYVFNCSVYTYHHDNKNWRYAEKQYKQKKDGGYIV